MGMGAAYNIGENTKSMILTRALAEMSRFAVKQGAKPINFLGFQVGDLFATCNSPLSRNYQIGFALVQVKHWIRRPKNWDKPPRYQHHCAGAYKAQELDVCICQSAMPYEVILKMRHQ